MALRERGQEQPEGERKPLGGAFRGEGNPDNKTPEELIEEIREIGGDGSVDALKLTVLGIKAYYLYEETQDDGDGEMFFKIIEELASLDKQQLRTVLASGIIALAEQRKAALGEDK